MKILKKIAPLVALYALACGPDVRPLDEFPDADSYDADLPLDAESNDANFQDTETDCAGRIIFYNNAANCIIDLNDLTYSPTGGIFGVDTGKVHTDESENVNTGESFLTSAEYDDIDLEQRGLTGAGESSAFLYLGIVRDGNKKYAVFLDYCSNDHEPQQRMVEVMEQNGTLEGRLSAGDGRPRWAFSIYQDGNLMSIDLNGDSQPSGSIREVYNDGMPMPIDNRFGCEF